MGAGRFVLPATLAGVACGILVADFGMAAPLPAAISGALLVGAGGVLGRRGALALILGVSLIGSAAGAWRQAATGPGSAGPSTSVASLADGVEHRVAGTVVDDPRPRADQLQVVLADVVVPETQRPFADRLLVWMPRGLDVRAGDRLETEARIELAEDFDGFAYREYLARQGVGAIARARGADAQPAAAGVGAWIGALRGTLLDGLNELVPEPEAALGAGILLGVRSSIAPEINDAFATAGLTHVVAISGWNIAIVAAIVLALVRPVGRLHGGRWTSALTAAGVVGGYVLLTGATPSVVRAALMAGGMLVGRLGGSRAHATSALGLAALVMLIVAPAVLWDVGFQLSLLATAGLIWFGRGIEARLARWPGWLREPVALTLAAQLTTLPVILVNFERLSLVAPISNVLVVPLVPLAMLASAAVSVGGVVVGALPPMPVGDAIAWFLGGAAWLVLRAMVVVGQATASLPFAAVDVSVPAPFAIAWFPLLALGTWALRTDHSSADAPRGVVDEAMTGTMAALGRMFRPLPALAGLVLLLGGITLATRPDGQLHVTALDIGQGDAILVEAPSGTTMLVDGGPDSELTLRRLGANLPFWARRIDVLVVSHPHQDHVAGLVDVLDRFRIGTVIHAAIPFENAAYERLLADAASGTVAVRAVVAGDTFNLDGSTTVEVLYPSRADAAAPLPEGDINNGSVVLLVRHGGFSALLTGDAEAPVEAALLARGRVPRVDVLKVGHHGSHSSSTPAFVAAARPSVALISAGEDNEYGHPASETLATLAAQPGIAVHRTDLEGDIEVASDGNIVRVRTDAGWGDPAPVQATADAGSIGSWPSPTEKPSSAWSTRPSCPTASARTPPASPAWPWPPRAWSRRPASRSTAGWSKRPRSSTTSTRPASVAAAASMGSSVPGFWRRRGTRSSPCRSPPTRSLRSSTRTATRWVGRRSSWPSPTGTWRSPSSPSTSAWTT